MQFSCLAHGTYDTDQIHCKAVGGNCPKKILNPLDFQAQRGHREMYDRNERKGRCSVLKFLQETNMPLSTGII